MKVALQLLTKSRWFKGQFVRQEAKDGNAGKISQWGDCLLVRKALTHAGVVLDGNAAHMVEGTAALLQR